MALTPSNMLALGTTAPPFDLPDPTGRHHRLADFAGCRGLVLMFICNHCPFVQHLRDELAGLVLYFDETVTISGMLVDARIGVEANAVGCKRGRPAFRKRMHDSIAGRPRDIGAQVKRSAREQCGPFIAADQRV